MLRKLLAAAIFVARTGVEGTYNVAFDWDEDPLSWLTPEFRDRFGIEIAPSREQLEALVIDDIRLDPSLSALARTGQLTRFAPQTVRNKLSRFLAIR